MPRYQPELAILKPKDPTAVEDDWPIFILNDAIVYRPDGVTMANAILVAKEGPCIVRGRVEVEDKEDFKYRRSIAFFSFFSFFFLVLEFFL